MTTTYTLPAAETLAPSRITLNPQPEIERKRLAMILVDGALFWNPNARRWVVEIPEIGVRTLTSREFAKATPEDLISLAV